MAATTEETSTDSANVQARASGAVRWPCSANTTRKTSRACSTGPNTKASGATICPTDKAQHATAAATAKKKSYTKVSGSTATSNSTKAAQPREKREKGEKQFKIQ